MFDALTRLFAEAPLLALVGGTFAGLLIGLMPGISGRVGLLLFLPLALVLDPLAGAVFLLAMHSVVHTSGAIPAILFGVPTSASESATVVDGFPMMRQGRGGEAVGATIAASAIGGVIGAIALLAFVPLARPIIELVGSAEIAVMGCIGIAAIAALAGGNMARGLIVAALGVLASTVGVEDMTGAQRFTFHSLDLWDGFGLAAVVTGLFVLPEALVRLPPPPAVAANAQVRLRDVLAGCRQTLRHRWLLLRASAIGIFVGFVPGIGSSVAVWLAYGHAVQTVRSKVPFGEGAVAGVIAAEAANNSKEGGSLAPTLIFGIPGTTGMGILLGAFLMMGIQAGPRLTTVQPGFVEAMAWTIMLANVLAVPFCLALTPSMTRFAALRRELVLPFAVLAAVLAVLATDLRLATLLELGGFGLLGVGLLLAGWPRAPFVLGFVMGPLLESTLSRAIAVYGWSLFERSGVQLLLLLALVVIWLAQRKLRRADHRLPSGSGPVYWLSLPLLLLLLAVLYLSLQLPRVAALLPLLACGVGLIALLLILFDRRRGAAGKGQRSGLALPNFVGLLAFGAATPLLGVPLASAVAGLLLLRWQAGLSWLQALLGAAALFLFAGYTAGEGLGLIRPFDAIERIVASALASDRP